MNNNKVHLNDSKSLKLFWHLLIPIYKDVYKYIYYFVKNEQMAEDIIEDTMLNAYYHFNDIKDINKFKSWIYTIAKHEAINSIKKYNKEIAIDIEEINAVFHDESNILEEYVLNNELRVAIIEAINTLSGKDRDIIILHYYNYIQLKDVASILQMNYNTIRTKHRSAKNKIHNYLVKKLFFTCNKSDKNDSIIK